MTKTRKPKRPPTLLEAIAPHTKTVARAEALAPLMTARHEATDPDPRPWNVDDVLYVALCAGLDELERRYAAKEPV